jgi:hypothetical protein
MRNEFLAWSKRLFLSSNNNTLRDKDWQRLVEGRWFSDSTRIFVTNNLCDRHAVSETLHASGVQHI